MKLCEKCGAENKDGSRYCQECGYPIPVDGTKRKKPVNKKEMAIGFFVVLAIILAYSSYIVKDMRQTEQYKQIKLPVEVSKGASWVNKEFCTYGILDGNGDEIIAPEYEELSRALMYPNSYVKNSFAEEYNVYVACKDGKYGFIDKDGNTVIDFVYDDALDVDRNGFALISQNGKYGVIDYQGNTVVEPIYNQYDSIEGYSLSFSYLGFNDTTSFFCMRDDSGLAVVVDSNGRTIVSGKDEYVSVIKPYDDFTYWSDSDEYPIYFLWGYGDTENNLYDLNGNRIYHSEGAITTKLNVDYGILRIEDTIKDEMVLMNAEEPYSTIGVYDWVGDIVYGDYIWVAENGSVDCYTLDGIRTSSLPDDCEAYGTFGPNGLAPVKMNGKWGYMDFNGDLKISCQYDKTAHFGNNGVGVVEKGEYKGLINESGNIILDPIYDSIYNLDSSVSLSAREGTYQEVVKNDRHGVVKTDGTWILDPEYDYIEPIFQSAGREEDREILAIEFGVNGQHGVVDLNGNIMIPQEYSEISGLYDIDSQLCGFAVKQNERYGVLDMEGEVQIPIQYATFDLGQQEIDEGYQYSNKEKYLLAAQDNNYGFIDQEGEWFLRLDNRY